MSLEYGSTQTAQTAPAGSAETVPPRHKRARDWLNAPFQGDDPFPFKLLKENPTTYDEMVRFRDSDHKYCVRANTKWWTDPSQDPLCEPFTYETTGKEDGVLIGVTSFLSNFCEPFPSYMAQNSATAINNHGATLISSERDKRGQIKKFQVKYFNIVPRDVMTAATAFRSAMFGNLGESSCNDEVPITHKDIELKAQALLIFYTTLKDLLNSCPYLIRGSDIHQYAEYDAERVNEIHARMKRGEDWVEYVVDNYKRQADALRILVVPPYVSAQDLSDAWPRMGKEIHFQIELLLNKQYDRDKNMHKDSAQFRMALMFLQNENKAKRVPYRTELCLVSASLGICGQLDAIFCDENQWYLYDWKVTTKIHATDPKYDDNNKSKSSMKVPVQCFPDTSRYKYYLQLNLYLYILHYDKGRVRMPDVFCSKGFGGLKLVVCDKTSTEARQSAACIDVPNLNVESETLEWLHKNIKEYEYIADLLTNSKSLVTQNEVERLMSPRLQFISMEDLAEKMCTAFTKMINDREKEFAKMRDDKRAMMKAEDEALDAWMREMEMNHNS